MKNERVPIELSGVDMSYSTEEPDFFSSSYNIHTHSTMPVIEATLKFSDGSGEIISNMDRYEYWGNRMKQCSNSYTVYKSQDLDDYNYWFEYTYNRKSKEEEKEFTEEARRDIQSMYGVDLKSIESVCALEKEIEELKNKVQFNENVIQAFKKLYTDEVEVSKSLKSRSFNLTKKIESLKNDNTLNYKLKKLDEDHTKKLKILIDDYDKVLEQKDETIGILNNRIQNCKEELDNKQINIKTTNGIKPFN